MVITSDILKQIAPASKRTGFILLEPLATWMNYWLPAAEIDTPSELCHFLAQAAHETDSFNSLIEYASGSAYEGRKDLGNVNPGDGVKYKGRGIFQTTGLSNYVRLDGVLNEFGISFENNPALLADPKWAVWSACVFWNDRHLSDIANMPDGTPIWVKRLDENLTPFQYITWRINGSIKTVPDRVVFYKRAKGIFASLNK